MANDFLRSLERNIKLFCWTCVSKTAELQFLHQHLLKAFELENSFTGI
jgi:hypothetical protein